MIKKDSKAVGVDLPLSGKLADLVWIRTSRKSPPNEKAAHAGDVVYNVETPEDLGRAFKQQLMRQ